MRWLMGVTIGMGVLIVVGVVVLAVLVVQRSGGGAGAAAATVALREAPGTRIAGSSLGPDRVAVQLTGGGPDRVVVVDLKTGRIAATIGLAP